MDTSVFQTKTEFRKGINPYLEKTIIIGNDLGYSSNKLFYADGCCCYPGFCREIKKDIFGELKANDIIYEDSDGSKYCVGEMATRSLKKNEVITESTYFGRNHYMAKEFLIQYRTGMAFALWNTQYANKNIYVQTGLPPQYLEEDSQYLKKVIQGTHEYKITRGNETKTFCYTIHPDNVDVISQPMGTLYSISTDRYGNFLSELRKYLNSDIMICDGGFGTWDTFMLKEKQVEIKDTNDKLGMKQVLEEARKLIKQELKIEITIPALQNCLSDGKITKLNRLTLASELCDITPYLVQANEMIKNQAFDSIKDFVFDIDNLVMTGGAGAAWYRDFSERLKNVKTLTVLPGNMQSDLPYIYANARGYYMYRYAMLKNKGG